MAFGDRVVGILFVFQRQRAIGREFHVAQGCEHAFHVKMPAAEDQGRVPILSPAKAATIMIRGIEKNRLHIYVGPDSRLMSVAIKVAPRPAIRFVQKQMSKRLPASHPLDALTAASTWRPP